MNLGDRGRERIEARLAAAFGAFVADASDDATLRGEWLAARAEYVAQPWATAARLKVLMDEAKRGLLPPAGAPIGGGAPAEEEAAQHGADAEASAARLRGWRIEAGPGRGRYTATCPRCGAREHVEADIGRALSLLTRQHKRRSCDATLRLDAESRARIDALRAAP